MGSITLFNYDGAYEYSTNSPSTIFSILVNELDLMQYAISAGGFAARAVTQAGAQFYASLIQMALTENNVFTIGDDYLYAETSIKNTLSLFMGMVAAKTVADVQYHIPYLFHLKDPYIGFTTNGRTPDFFGLSNGDVPTLIEAKGTSELRPSNTVIQSAKDQLADIIEINVLGMNRYQEFQRHVIASGFYNDTLTYYDIDPQPQGDQKISFDINKAMISYYKNIIGLLSSGTPQSMSYNNERYLYVKINDIKVGLSESIYSYLKRFYLPGGGFLRESTLPEKELSVYKDILSMSRELFTVEKNEEISLHQDGIICFV